MKNFDYYTKPNIFYPRKQDYITYYVYNEGKVITKTVGYEKSKTLLKYEYPGAVIQEILDKKAFEEHQRQFDEELQSRLEEFKNDLYEEFGVSDNPKRHKAYEYAWENESSYGLSKVHEVFGQLVELIED
jgi:hypothetical protein